jgi:hypothetical protein
MSALRRRSSERHEEKPRARDPSAPLARISDKATSRRSARTENAEADGTEGANLEKRRTATETADALEDLRLTLDVVVAHLGLEREVQGAIEAKRAKAERSRQEIERSLGHGVDAEQEAR